MQQSLFSKFVKHAPREIRNVRLSILLAAVQDAARFFVVVVVPSIEGVSLWTFSLGAHKLPTLRSLGSQRYS
jgi:hypothetical protein